MLEGLLLPSLGEAFSVFAASRRERGRTGASPRNSLLTLNKRRADVGVGP